MQFPNVPEQLETERLIIRPPVLKDVPDIHEAMIESLETLQPWMLWAAGESSLETCEESVRQAIAKFVTREDLRYHFHDKATGRFLVGSGLHRINWKVPKVEIGYWCRRSATGKGYVTEGVKALTQMAFDQLGMVRVEIRCDDSNIASIRVAERCGFELEGVLRKDSRSVSGELRSTRVYALVRAA